jgi:glucose-1-phosphatase
MREPRFIYFDLGNVLLRFDHRIAARNMAQLAGITEEQAWNVVFQGDLECSYEAGKLTTLQFHEAFGKATSTCTDFDRFQTANAEIFEVNARIVPIVAHLHAARYPLGILSNTSEIHWNYVSRGRYAVIQYFFEVHALSFKLRAMKPERRMYDEAAKLAGFAPEEIFFTDDRPENVEGAKEAGFDAVLFESPYQLANELRARGVRWNY